ncbi:MAG: plastocyanin domain-containing protein [Oleispira sp.]|jgi:plastocyanin domain-containing protein
MMMMIINLIGLLVIALIVWWFWLYKPTEAEVGENTGAQCIKDDPSAGDEGRNI